MILLFAPTAAGSLHRGGLREHDQRDGHAAGRHPDRIQREDD